MVILVVCWLRSLLVSSHRIIVLAGSPSIHQAHRFIINHFSHNFPSTEQNDANGDNDTNNHQYSFQIPEKLG